MKIILSYRDIVKACANYAREKNPDLKTCNLTILLQEAPLTDWEQFDYDHGYRIDRQNSWLQAVIEKK